MQRRKIALTICLGLAVMLVSSAALAQYQLTNLVSNGNYILNSLSAAL
jgi:hypothetical protein